jgi:hypothetical protein
VADLTPEVLPSVWSLIRRSLVEAPGMSRDELVERLTPRGLIERREGEQTIDDSRHVRPSLGALLDLGVVADDGTGRLELQVGADSEVAFRRAVTRRAFDVGSGDEDEVWRMRSEHQPEHHAEVALAWLHLQGVADPITSFPSAEERLQKQFGPAQRVLRDTAPFNSLERLGRWCGVAAHVAGDGAIAGVVPDPTEAFRCELDEIIERGADVPARDVINRISDTFSWLPNGTVGRAVAARMTDVPDTAAARGDVPESVSLALIQLHHEGVLELVGGDDASDRVALSPGGLVDASGAEVGAVARIRRKASA